MSQFKVGDVVKWKAQDVKLTIYEIDTKSNTIYCKHLNPVTGVFDNVALKPEEIELPKA